MTIVPTVSELVDTSTLAVPLPLYAQIIGYDECAFYGISRADPPAVHSLKPLWKKSERDQVAHFLAEAQAELEAVIGYPLVPRWVASEQHTYTVPLLSKWSNIIEAGIEASADVSLGEAVDHTTDPAQIGPVATTVTDEDEIKVYHPGTDTEIPPSAMTFAGGFVTILVPRARLLTEQGEASTAGIDYTDTGAIAGNFEQTVDIKRIYNDSTTQGVLVWPHDTDLCCESCSEATETACITILNADIGKMDVLRADYASGSWARKSLSCYCCVPQLVRINYRAGLTTLTAQARDAIVRLAHSKLPHSPCNCDPANWVWARDRHVPDVLTRERLNCPFGLSDGAWIAYRFAMNMKMYRGSTL